MKTTNTDPRCLHAQAIKSLTTNISTYNNLITHYSKPHHNLLPYSLRIFHQIPSPNLVSWTALISAYTASPFALHLFLRMLRHPILPNQRTLASLFKTCASITHSLPFGLSLHSLSLKLCLSNKPFSGSALIHFYNKYQLPDYSYKVFDEMPERDNVSYSAMIVGLAQNSRPVDAITMFVDMRSCDLHSTSYSVSGALHAAAVMAAMEQCRIIHGHAVVYGLDGDLVVGSALVDAYGKGGQVDDARRVFDENMDSMNIVGWNSLLAAYAQQGDHKSLIDLFESMVNRGFAPDKYTFLAILTAHYNTSSVVETEKWVKKMKEDYGLEPGLEHYTCLIGAMGRVGRFKEAERIVMEMPFEADAAVWRALLSAAAYCGAPDVARSMGKRLLELDPSDDSAYVIVANMLSSAGKLDEVAEMRKMMKDKGVKKVVGRSWIEVKGKVHVFMAGDVSHEPTEEIYGKLGELMEAIEKLGYKPVYEGMLHGVGEEAKRKSLWGHSEKLALAFGVVSGVAPKGKALRIVKNLRICKDCHEAFKYMSIVVDREIIVRDVNRYHKFIEGYCTCRDIW